MDIEQLKLIISSLEGTTEKAAWVAGAWIVSSLIKSIVPIVLWCFLALTAIKAMLKVGSLFDDNQRFIMEIARKKGVRVNGVVTSSDIEKLREKLEL